MSDSPTNPPMYKGWVILPCPVPLLPWPQRRYFLTDRPSDCNEFEGTMYEDFVDAFCADHAIARAESLFGRSWGSLRRIEWISPEGETRVSEFPRSYRLLPDGGQEETRMPQREAKPEWRDAVAKRDEAAILRLMRQEMAEAGACLNPSAESGEELSELARRQKVLLQKALLKQGQTESEESREQGKTGGAA